MNTNYYDIIIIGAGLAGLYSAYNIKKIYPKTNLLVLESNKRPYIGGRIGNDSFYGADIVVGAGVGRKDTDKLLIKLLHNLNIDYHPFKVNMHYSKLIKNPVDVKQCLYDLREQYKKYKNPPSITFKQFATQHLGNAKYRDFVISTGYSDYQDEDVHEVLYHYQMDDNSPGWTALNIPWFKLVDTLCNHIGKHNIKTSNKVESIDKILEEPCVFKVATNKNVYFSNKVIIATRINTVRNLLPKYNIYNQIQGQPFLYVYAKFDKKSSELMQQIVSTYTIVPGLLQKMIPFSNGVYMIAYADNKNAEVLKTYLENTPKNRHFFERQVENALDLHSNSLKIIAIKNFYWPIGTHYYEPLDTKKYNNRSEFIREAQHPEKGLLVVGEAVSRRQGWTEGALESVHAVLNKKWIDNINC
jgi:hypothetical protein